MKDPAHSWQCSGLCPGDAEALAVVSRRPASVSRIDAATGIYREPGHELDGQRVAGKILLMPCGKGSSSASYFLLSLAEQRTAPAALVVTAPDAVLIAGAVLANIPLIYGFAAAHMERIDLSCTYRVDGTSGVLRRASV